MHAAFYEIASKNIADGRPVFKGGNKDDFTKEDLNVILEPLKYITWEGFEKSNEVAE